MENVGVTMKPKHGMPCMAKWKNSTKGRTASKVGTFFFSGRAKKKQTVFGRIALLFRYF